jgi:hypothetical protein
VVFLNSPHQETPKNAIKDKTKKIEQNAHWIFYRLF